MATVRLRFSGGEYQKMLSSLFNRLDRLDKQKEYVIEVKEYRKRRSNDANALFWLFCGKLAETAGLPLEDIYKGLIRNLGGNFDVICIQQKAAQTFIKHWEGNGMGWFCEELPSKVAGCVNLMCFYGSSVYDTKQMSRLIESLLEECEQFDIDTRSLEEIAIMKG